MIGPGDEDERTLPDAEAPVLNAPSSRVPETFDDESPLSFVPPPVAPSRPPQPASASKVPLLLRALSPASTIPMAVPAPETSVELDEDALIDPDEVVREWARSLDTIDYFSLLALPLDADLGEERVREAWRAFALAFHPDRHRDAPDDVRIATTHVFQRGAEAYRVLQDPVLRRRYLELLERDGAVRMSHDQVASVKQEGDGSLARDLVHSPAARAFAEQADQLLAAGRLEAARLQLQLALMREAGNERLARLLREVEQRIAASRPFR